MAIYQTDWHWFSAWGSGFHTIDVNIAPAWVGAQTNLYGQLGGGANFTGISHYRRRLSSGKDKDHDLGAWGSWPPVIYDYISSITFAIATGSEQQAWLVARMDYWN